MGSLRLTLECAVTTDPGQTPVWEDWTEWWAGEAGTRAQLCSRQTELDRFGAGSLSVSLDNTTRRFDPTNTAGPYYGYLLPMRRMRVRGAWNLLPAADDSEFAGGVGSWTALANCSLSTTIAAGTGGATGLCLLLTKTGGSAPISAISGAMPADESTPYAAAAYLRVVGGALPIAGRLRLRFYSGPNGTGTLLSTASSADVSTSTAGLWLRATVAAVSPAGTASMRLVVESNTANNTDTYGAANVGVYQTDAVPAHSALSATDLVNVNIERFPLEYAGPEDAWVPVSGVDGFKALNLLTLPKSVYEFELDTDNPIHRWRLNEVEGSTVVEDTVGTSDGVYTADDLLGDPVLTLGGSSLIAGGDGTSATIGISNSIGSTPAPDPIKIPAAGKTGDFTFEFVAQYSGDEAFTFLYLNSPGANFAVNISGDTVMGIAGVATIVGPETDDQPHHYAATRSGNTWTFYVDGVSQGTASNASVPTSFVLRVIAPTTEPALTIQNIAMWDTALTGTRVQAHAKAALGTAWAGDLPGARLARYLDMAGWPAADRSLDTGNTPLQAASTLDGSLLAACQLVADDTENGKFYIRPDNKVRFVNRRGPLTDARSLTSQATFSDWGPLDYESITFGDDDAEIRNDVRITREGGLEQTATDATSVGRFYARTYTRSGTLNQTDVGSADLAGWLLAHFKDPLARIDQITISPYGNDAYWPLILSLTIGDRVTVVRHPPGGGTAITVDSLIEGVAHDFDPQRWTTTYQLSQTETAFVSRGYGTFVLGTDRMAY